jgi:surface antigen
MKKIMTIALLGALSFCLAGCDNMKKQDVGVLTGGAIGGLVGSQFGKGEGRIVGAAVGAVAGSLIGGQIGRNMDKVDHMRVERVLEKTPTNQTTSWRNPDTHVQYAVTPTETYYVKRRPCRRYVVKAWINGKQRYIHGRACRMPNGTWRAID